MLTSKLARNFSNVPNMLYRRLSVNRQFVDVNVVSDEKSINIKINSINNVNTPCILSMYEIDMGMFMMGMFMSQIGCHTSRISWGDIVKATYIGDNSIQKLDQLLSRINQSTLKYDGQN